MKRRQLNIRTVIISFALLTVVGAIVYFVRESQLDKSAVLFKENGIKAEENKDYAKALDYYNRYFVFEPDDIDVRVRYALILSETASTSNQHRQALFALERVLRTEPHRSEIRRKAAEEAIAIERFSDARIHLEKLLAETPNDVELLTLLASAEEQDLRFAQAIVNYQEVIKLQPDRIDAYDHIASLYRRLNKPEQADAVMDQMIDANPKSAQARLIRSNELRQLGRIEAAADDIRFARNELNSTDAEVLLASAELKMNQVDYADQASSADAINAVKEEFALGQSNYPDDIRFPLELSSFYLRLGESERAEQIAIEAKSLAKEKPAQLWFVADTLITTGQHDEAAKIIQQLDATRLAPSAVNFLKARLSKAEGNWTRTIELIEKFRLELFWNSELALRTEIMLAECYGRLGKTDQQRDVYQRMLGINPTSIPARRGLADIELARGNVDEAIRKYRELLGAVPELRFTVARLLLWQNANKPEAQRNWGNVIATLEGLPERLKNSGEYVLIMTDIELAQGARAEALKTLNAAKDENPKEPRYWLALFNLTRGNGEYDKAVSILDMAEAEAGDQVAFRLARAQLALEQKGKEAGETLQTLEANMEKFSTSEQANLLLGLANDHRRIQNTAEANRLMKQAAELRTGDIEIQLTLLDFASDQDDVDQLTKIRDTLRRIEGESGTAWKYADAVRLAKMHWKNENAANEQAARKRIEQVRKQRSEWYRPILLEALLDDRSNNVEQAIENYMQAIRLGAKFPQVAQRTVQLLVSRRRFDEAREVIRQFGGTERSPEFGKMMTELALFENRSNEQVLELLKTTVSKDSTQAGDHLWRGFVLAMAGQPDEAETAHRRAIELAPRSLNGWLMLTQFLVEAGKVSEAKKTIDEASQQLDPKDLPDYLAVALEAVGERTEALKQHQTLLEANPNDPALLRGLVGFHLRGGETELAKPYLKKLINSKGGNLQWARRTLALTLATTGNYQDGSEALRLIADNLDDRPDSPQDLRAQALILADRPGERKQSIRILEDSYRRLRPTDQEQFLLARLYELDGDWKEAREQFTNVLAGSGRTNVAFIAHFIRSLLREGETATAAVWTDRLEKLPGQEQSVTTLDLRARVLHAQGENDKAATVLKEYANAQYDQSKNPEYYRWAGVLLAELGQSKEAEAFLRRYTDLTKEKQPLAIADLVLLLARQNRVSDALELCEEAYRHNADPATVIRLAVAVVRIGQANKKELDRLESFLQMAMKEHPMILDLRISWADLLDAEDRYEEAIREYRQLLNQVPSNALILNNLAWLLTFRTNNHSEALTLIDRAIAFQGPTANLLDTRGVILTRMDRHAEAISDLTAATNQENVAPTYFHLAQAFAQSRNNQEAERFFRRAMEMKLDPKSDLHPLEQPAYEQLQRETGV